MKTLTEQAKHITEIYWELQKNVIFYGYNIEEFYMGDNVFIGNENFAFKISDGFTKEMMEKSLLKQMKVYCAEHGLGFKEK